MDENDIFFPTARSAATPEERIVESMPPPPEPRLKPPARRGFVVGGVLIALVLVTMAIAGLRGTFAWSSQRVNRSVMLQQTFTVANAPTITLDATVGNITINPGPMGRVSIVATKIITNVPIDTAQRFLDRMQIALNQTNDTFNFTTLLGVQTPGSGSQQIDLALMVPPSSNVILTATAGQVSLSGLTGAFNLSLASGPLRLQELTVAADSHFSADVGNVAYSGKILATANLTIDVGVGNVTMAIPQATMAVLAAGTRAGKIVAKDWSTIQVAADGLGGRGAKAAGKTQAGATAKLSIAVSVGDILLQAT